MRQYLFETYYNEGMKDSTLLYISGAVTGVEDYLALFNDAERVLLEAGYRVCNPVRLCHSDWKWERCMKTVLKAMMDCDALALLDNWKQSRGANLEVYLAKELRMPIKLIGEWRAPH